MAFTYQAFGNAGGQYGESAGTHTITCGGGDVYQSDEHCGFAHVEMTGDFDVSARCVSKSGGGFYAKLGLLLREGLGAGARLYGGILEASSTRQNQRRTSANGEVNNNGIGNAGAPFYLRMTRVGSTLALHTSEDGSTWSTALAVATYAGLASTVNVGLYVVNQDAGVPSTTGTFDAVTGFPAGGVEGSGALALPGATLSGAGMAAATASGEVDLVGAVVSAMGQATAEASGALTLNGATLSGTATWGVEASGALVSGVGALAGTGVTSGTGSGALLAPRVVLAGVLVGPVGAVTARRLVVVGAQVRVRAVAWASRVASVEADA